MLGGWVAAQRPAVLGLVVGVAFLPVAGGAGAHAIGLVALLVAAVVAFRAVAPDRLAAHTATAAP